MYWKTWLEGNGIKWTWQQYAESLFRFATCRSCFVATAIMRYCTIPPWLCIHTIIRWVWDWAPPSSTICLGSSRAASFSSSRIDMWENDGTSTCFWHSDAKPVWGSGKRPPVYPEMYAVKNSNIWMANQTEIYFSIKSDVRSTCKPYNSRWSHLLKCAWRGIMHEFI